MYIEAGRQFVTKFCLKLSRKERRPDVRQNKSVATKLKRYPTKEKDPHPTKNNDWDPMKDKESDATKTKVLIQ